jgi:hypothetical protein
LRYTAKVEAAPSPHIASWNERRTYSIVLVLAVVLVLVPVVVLV